MSISQLTISHFRNLTQISLQPSPELNIFVGNNASGKTSLLESIYQFSRPRSFRTNKNTDLITVAQQSYTLFAIIKQNDELNRVGLSRNREGKLSISINRESINQFIPVSQLFPISLITPESVFTFMTQAKERRRFFDLGVFHVKPHYAVLWNHFQKLLKQRNSLLRSKSYQFEQQLIYWDQKLAEAVVKIDQYRTDYLQQLQAKFYQLCEQVNWYPQQIKLKLSSGWNQGKYLNFFDYLQQQLARDLKMGYTQGGPHRADLKFEINDNSIDLMLSKGEQKIFYFILQVAQTITITSNKGFSLLLIDDLSSEIDHNNLDLLLTILSLSPAQQFITALSDNLNQATLDRLKLDKQLTMFHVKQGQITKS